ncbi:GNAT family N-acetyltransferase [Actomonas aquatica]|uniref:GNAT family N-acyltransferase n=1 Tax=Actomonas aquatica TaxID=2866162 RepID=A0ABZ1C7C5_9BACT|nr:GNAT family N-acyltransferase [Opitutus sp. WL0086]WRQ87158.1 GNAT family N-acyltransferase [Opitutus sp. WL0086]
MSVQASFPPVGTERYRVHFAANEQDLWAAQRLRFEVFNLELNEGLVASHMIGRDEDGFDPVCEHLLVTDQADGKVVGTYRMQAGLSAAAHLGYYSEQEFDFGPFAARRGEILELGRACVAAEHRNQSVLSLLWRAIMQHARRRGQRYLIGCSSLSSLDEAGGLETYRNLAAHYLAAPEWRTRPVASCRCRSGTADALAVPRLMVAYLAAGARVCGEPAIDREFGTIDFLTVLDLDALSPRFARKYLA